MTFHLRAGGSIDVPALSAKQKMRRIGELILLYCGVPLLLTYLLYTWRVPLFFSLQPVLLVLLIAMVSDRSFSLRKELLHGFNLGTLAEIFVLFAPEF